MTSRTKMIALGGAAFALVVLLINGAVARVNASSIADADRAVVNTYEIRSCIERVLTTLTDAETGQRGFLITGDPRYLAPYTAALARIRSDFDELKILISGAPAQEAFADILEAKAAAKMAELANTVALRRDFSFEAAREVVVTNVGQNLMEEMRGIAAEMERAEDERLKNRRRDATIALATTQTATIIGTLGGVAMVALAYYLTYRDRTAELTRANTYLKVEIDERVRAEKQVRAAAEELERSNRELQEFAFVASHDLQEPLRKIRAFGDRLKDQCGEALSTEGDRLWLRVIVSCNRQNTNSTGFSSGARLGRKCNTTRPARLATQRRTTRLLWNAALSQITWITFQ